MERALAWCVENDGECLGDHPERLQAALLLLHEPVAYARQHAPGVVEEAAQWMMARGYATGPGDTISDLLDELAGQVRERTLEEAANMVDGYDTTGWSGARVRDAIATCLRALVTASKVFKGNGTEPNPT